ncbi:MAG: radical SAM protein [Elusimicrobia bacterium]|nr:radical SAM protein [Elusimicrobiota bacterium]
MQSVFVGFRCNNACVFCAQGNLRSTEPPLTNSSVLQKIRQIIQSALFKSELAFVGGEPTLHQELPGWISEAKHLGAKWILVQTNGRRLTYPGYAHTLKKAGADALDVSLQGSTTAMHDYHTNVPGSCAQTLLGIERACKAGMQVGTTTVITRSNFRHLEEIVRLAHSKGVRAVHLDLATPYGKAYTHWARIVPAMELARPYLISAVRTARTLGLKVNSHKLFAGLGEVEPRPSPLSDFKDQTRYAPSQRPAPGHGEIHTPQKKTGESLQEIFPALFHG